MITNQKAKQVFPAIIMGCLLILLSLISLFIGVKDVTISGLLSGSAEELQILLIGRIPRLMSILLAGIGLSVAGVIMQQISSNRFISPTTGSTIEWARFGVLAAILFFPQASSMVKMLIAFVFAFLGTAMFMKLLREIKLKDAAIVPLVGILFGSVIGSVSTYLAYQHDLVQTVSSWMQSSFTLILRGRYELLYLVIPFIVIAFLYARNFTVIAMGKDMSLNLGISYYSTVYIGLIIVAVISASVVVTVGTVPFIGVIIPNIVRMYRGDHLEKSLLDIALAGACFLLACDIVSRLIIYPFEIPVSVTSGVIGCIVFIFILAGRKSYETN